MSGEPEIWFEKWLWSYIPCHWKGFAMIAMMVAAILGSFGVFSLVAALLHRPWIADLTAVSFIVVLGFGMRIADRHSRKIGVP